ncbi:DNA adenine methylase [Campylobacter curvus]|uniref:DNA adenine methylase n=1 Tax=Campylobacter curvus TaxID=200 RepID=UPI0014704579|nr:DNA adenine methylase [Campylobacter curvus]
MNIKSPLRYPGGKSQLTKFVSHTIEINSIKNPIYCEPFCGGGGVAINLLLDKKVDKIILNDFDAAIYSFWYAVLNDTEKLIRKINEIKITIDERLKQKEIYMSNQSKNKYNFNLGFATLFLNRTNVSGIIKGGAIGGNRQQGTYKLDCRFNKEYIISKIYEIAKHKNDIVLYNLEANDFIKNVLPKFNQNNLFIFFDPPYYRQGKNLYTNFFNHKNHEDLSLAIKKLDKYFWILTYDNEPEIINIYNKYNPKKYKLQYSAKNKLKEVELFFNSKITIVESFDKVIFK